ncbi:MAG TPA: hypothetical protein VGO93_04895 [Candidatus Xenobia bacterium]|jgi:hypothetical protein
MDKGPWLLGITLGLALAGWVAVNLLLRMQRRAWRRRLRARFVAFLVARHPDLKPDAGPDRLQWSVDGQTRSLTWQTLYDRHNEMLTAYLLQSVDRKQSAPQPGAPADETPGIVDVQPPVPGETVPGERELFERLIQAPV